MRLAPPRPIAHARGPVLLPPIPYPGPQPVSRPPSVKSPLHPVETRALSSAGERLVTGRRQPVESTPRRKTSGDCSAPQDFDSSDNPTAVTDSDIDLPVPEVVPRRNQSSIS